MLSLKRLLNYDACVDEYYVSSEALVDFPAQSETTPSAEISWDGLWGSILSSEIPDRNNVLQIDIDRTTETSIRSVEESIGQWATDSMPLMNNPSLNLQDASPEPIKTNTPGCDSGLLCYGMLYRVATRVEGNMPEIDATLKSNLTLQASDSCTFNVGKSSGKIILQFPDGRNFGGLNDQVCKALQSLILLPNLCFEAIGSVQTIRDIIGRVTKAPDAVVRVNIKIYGPRESKSEVGRHLSSQQLYLQKPGILRNGSTYENPHLLTFPDFQLSSSENQFDVRSNKALKADNTEHLREAISNVYSSLTRGTHLNKTKGDRRLKSKILPHQEEALHYMLQRENGPIPQEYRLWKAMEGENEGCYLHAVTKARNRNPASETGGGILADEMGMGKTLSTLALITKTLENALEWVAAKKANPDDHTRQKPSRATLVVVPSAMLINEWCHEISLHLDGSLKPLKYHGPKRKALPLEDAEIILTTYHTIVSDYKDRSSPLHAMEWYRIVLDEAHIIRRQVTTFFRAVTELKARSRWCLSGTPIQNKLDDVGSLFAFIRVHPFHHPGMFRRFVSIPFDESKERRKVATKNLTLLLESLCLRRSRDLLKLPEPQERTQVIRFSLEEREQYERTKKMMNRTLRHKVGESYEKSIFGMFQVQLQLRILCNHGTYQQPFSWAKRSLLNEREDALCALGGEREFNCSLCRQSLPMFGTNDLYQRYPGSCAHIICRECLGPNQHVNDVAIGMEKKCPLCVASGVYSSIDQSEGANEERGDSYLRHHGYSSKIIALVSDIKENIGQTKSIVFSCWTNTLNLIGKHFLAEDIAFHRIDGETPPTRRQQILDEFSNVYTVRVLIMTTGTGAFGLNLTTANRVFIMEPQWNPSVENQAVARAIRMNQRNSVLVTRYMIEGSVEQEMRSQQKKKLMIAEIGTSNPS